MWFFRAIDGRYGLKEHPPTESELQLRTKITINGEPTLLFFQRKPRGMPTLSKDSCIPVALRAEGE